MPLQPTALWTNPVLVVPDLGTVRHPRGGDLNADPGIIEWLKAQGYVTEIEESTVSQPTPPLEEPSQHDDSPVHEVDQSSTDRHQEVSGDRQDDEQELEPWQSQVLEFFSLASQDEIAEIKGISVSKAKDIIDLRNSSEVLTWDALDKLLTAAHFKALQTHFQQEN